MSHNHSRYVLCSVSAATHMKRILLLTNKSQGLVEVLQARLVLLWYYTCTDYINIFAHAVNGTMLNSSEIQENVILRPPPSLSSC